MGSVGFPEIAVILLIALLVFGPDRLPGIGRSLGSAVRQFRSAVRELSASVDEPELKGTDQAAKEGENR